MNAKINKPRSLLGGCLILLYSTQLDDEEDRNNESQESCSTTICKHVCGIGQGLPS